MAAKKMRSGKHVRRRASWRRSHLRPWSWLSFWEAWGHWKQQSELRGCAGQAHRPLDNPTFALAVGFGRSSGTRLVPQRPAALPAHPDALLSPFPAPLRHAIRVLETTETAPLANLTWLTTSTRCLSPLQVTRPFRDQERIGRVCQDRPGKVQGCQVQGHYRRRRDANRQDNRQSVRPRRRRHHGPVSSAATPLPAGANG